MELWIRSQDKRNLLKVDNINWFGAEIYTRNRVDLETTKDGKTYLLGRYNNGKRALEVLDEIQEILTPKIITTYENQVEIHPEYTIQNTVKTIPKTEIQELSTYVYEMPQE